MSPTIPGFRIEYSTKQSFDVYDIFDDVVEGGTTYEIAGVTVRYHSTTCVEVIAADGTVNVCYYPEALENELERLGVLEP